MTTGALHPDQLQPGQWVGAWRILSSLGTGGFGRTFKVERDGVLFSLKMAVRPASEDREVEGRLAHEAAALMANSSHPNLPRLYVVDRWPHPDTGYLFFVAEYIEGETFNDWRARTRPTASELVDIFLAVVLAVMELHRRRLLHRDLTGSNIVIRKKDTKPFFIDLSSVWLPGSSNLTEQLPPIMVHALPPECVTFLRRSTQGDGKPFDSSEAGDLYQLGVFMFEALTECHPFDPKKLAPAELFAAIETIVPRAPHYINPQVPQSLSRIVMQLLEKRPEDRHASAELLHQALWEAAKERKSRGWKLPLLLPESGPAPATQEELEERKAQQHESELRGQQARKQEAEALSDRQAMEKMRAATQEFEAGLQAIEEAQARRERRRRGILAGVGVLLLGAVLLATAFPATLEKGSSLVSPINKTRPMKAVATWLCVTFSLGCPAVQLRPLPEDCPPEAAQSMKELKFLGQWDSGDVVRVIIDINQPGDQNQDGTYHEGKIVSKVVKGPDPSPIPEETLLYGQLWTEGLTREGREVVYGRWTEAVLPDGRRVPVCMSLGDRTGMMSKFEGSKPGAARLPRKVKAWTVLFLP
jgi:serine/threonine protein kinase